MMEVLTARLDRGLVALILIVGAVASRPAARPSPSASTRASTPPPKVLSSDDYPGLWPESASLTAHRNAMPRRSPGREHVRALGVGPDGPEAQLELALETRGEPRLPGACS